MGVPWNLQNVLTYYKMTGFSLWYIKAVYDITQLAEAETKIKLKYYTIKSVTIPVGNVMWYMTWHDIFYLMFHKSTNKNKVEYRTCQE